MSNEQRATSNEQRATSGYYVLKQKLKSNKYTYHLIFRPLRFIKRIVFRTFCTFYWLPYLIYAEARNFLYHDVIFAQCWVTFSGYVIKHNNWGDDINKYFLEYATGKKLALIPCDQTLFNVKHYSLIGSIVSFYNLNQTTIYGSGIMTATDEIKGRPEKIISVRGPLTRNALIEKGIECPENYGDPALLLPMFYKPDIKQNNTVLIIPNRDTLMYYDYGNRIIDEMQNKYGCSLVNMFNYDKWTDIVDAIASSKFVMSESLHGLIVAETYGVPCLWVEFMDHARYYEYNSDWLFKFRDFYKSIGKFNMQITKLYNGYDFNELIKLKDSWQPGKIDFEKLLSLFPFDIKPEFNKS